jgi:glucose dehydrogenase
MPTRYSKLRKYLIGTTVAVGMLTAAPTFADDALDQALKSDSNWPMYGRTYDNTRFSPLNQITTRMSDN